jgi:hypothetical protein
VNKEDLLNLCVAEQRRSIGFDLDAELTRQRQVALEYYKGQMTDVPNMPNRSAAVSMDVRDTIQAVIPDIIDIFTGGDDVASFVPRTAEDEEQAQQETDYVEYTVFEDNDGWWVIYQALLDAFQAKTGVIKVYTEESVAGEEELFEGKTWAEVELASEDGEIVDLEPCDDPEQEELAGEPLFDFTLKKPKDDDKVRIATVAPEDITVARDTGRISEATYCAVRMRPRAQDLIAQGIPKDKVDQLSEWQNPGYAQERYSRDTVNEETMVNGSADQSMRQVLVTEHYIRIKDKKGDKLYCVLTGGEQDKQTYLRHEEVSQIPIAVFTPYPVTHHFYGLSVADLAIDVQRIKTVLLRQMLDEGYFALNQRAEISEMDSTEDTVDDFLLNEPGRPVRSRTGNAIKPIQLVPLNFNVMEQLEHMATVLEERTGIIRGAQGLNPDSLHDTASGAMALLSRAQRRVRMLARTLAETGFKDLYMIVHAMLRQTASKARVVRLRGKWVETNPSSWSARTSMKIEIGLGAGGRDQDLLFMQQVLALQEKGVELQGGAQGPLVDIQNIYNAVTRFAERGGVKDPGQFFTNPEENPQPPQPPQPDPKMVEVQGKMEIEKAKLQLSAQSDQAKIAQDQEKGQAEYELKMQEMQGKLQIQRETAQAELELKRELLIAELQMKREELAAKLQLQKEQIDRDGERKDYETSVSVSSDVRPGGDPG